MHVDKIIAVTANSDCPYQLLLNGVSIGATDGPAPDLESSEKWCLVTARHDSVLLIA